MRIAVLSDIHGNLAALEAVKADLSERGVDQVVNLGDSLSGPLMPLETAQFLMSEGWMSVAGNHERQLLTLAPEQRGPSDGYAHAQLTDAVFEWLRSLPPVVRFDCDVLFCHGTPATDSEYLLETVDAHGVRPATPAEIGARIGHETGSMRS